MKIQNGTRKTTFDVLCIIISDDLSCFADGFSSQKRQLCLPGLMPIGFWSTSVVVLTQSLPCSFIDIHINRMWNNTSYVKWSLVLCTRLSLHIQY